MSSSKLTKLCSRFAAPERLLGVMPRIMFLKHIALVVDFAVNTD